MVERDGELYAQIVAVVRRVTTGSVTLYLPATDHTFTIRPDSSARVLLGGRTERPRELVRGQEIRIYLSTSAFTKPDVEEVTLVTESEAVVQHFAEPVAALPTTG